MSTSPPTDAHGLIRAALAGRIDEVCRIEGPLAVDGSASIYRVTAGAGRLRLAAKFCTDPADACGQFAALTAAAAAMNIIPSGGLRVPAPVALFEEHGLVVMEWIDGRSFAAVLHAPWQRPALALADAARVGVWLAGYHAVSPAAVAPFDYARGLTMLDAVLAPLENDRCAFTVGRRWLARLDRMAARNGSIPLPISLQHGDFKPGNVLLTADAVYGIDLHSQYRSSVVEDIAYFLVDMELACFHPRGLRLLRHREALTRRFLGGYGVERRAGLAALVDWLRLHKIARNWATLHSGERRGVQRRYAAVCLRRMARGAI